MSFTQGKDLLQFNPNMVFLMIYATDRKGHIEKISHLPIFREEFDS